MNTRPSFLAVAALAAVIALPLVAHAQTPPATTPAPAKAAPSATPATPAKPAARTATPAAHKAHARTAHKARQAAKKDEARQDATKQGEKK